MKYNVTLQSILEQQDGVKILHQRILSKEKHEPGEIIERRKRFSSIPCPSYTVCPLFISKQIQDTPVSGCLADQYLLRPVPALARAKPYQRVTGTSTTEP